MSKDVFLIVSMWIS